MNKNKLLLGILLTFLAVAICVSSVKADSRTDITWDIDEGYAFVEVVNFASDALTTDWTLVSTPLVGDGSSTGTITFRTDGQLFLAEKDITIDSSGEMIGEMITESGKFSSTAEIEYSARLATFDSGYFRQYFTTESAPYVDGMTWYMQGGSAYSFSVSEIGLTSGGGRWSFSVVQNGLGDGTLWIGSNDRSDVSDLNNPYTGFTASFNLSGGNGKTSAKLDALTQNLLDYEYTLMDDGKMKYEDGRIAGGQGTLHEWAATLNSLSFSGDIQEF